MGARPGHLVVAGHFGAGNLGDDSILDATLALVEQVSPGRSVVVAGYDVDRVLARHAVTHAVHLGDLNDCDAALDGAAALVVGGGGVYFDYDGITPSGVLATDQPWAGLYRLPFLARARDVPLGLLGVGLGPFLHDSGRRTAGAVCRDAAVATLRDTGSHRLFVELGGRPLRSATTSDATWSLPAVPEDEREAVLRSREVRGDYVAVALRRPVFGDGVDVAGTVEALSTVARERRLAVAVLAMEVAPGAADVALAEEVAARLQQAGVDVVPLLDLTAVQAAAVLQGASACLAVRLHAMLLGAATGCPTVSLGYDPKIAAQAAELGLSEFHLPLDADGRAVSAALRRCLDEGPVLRGRVAGRAAALSERRSIDRTALELLLSDATDVLPLQPLVAGGQAGSLDVLTGQSLDVLAGTVHAALAELGPLVRSVTDLTGEVRDLQHAVSDREASMQVMADRVAAVEREAAERARAHEQALLDVREDHESERRALRTSADVAQRQVAALAEQLGTSTQLLAREEVSLARPVARRALRLARTLGRRLDPDRQQAVRAALAPVVVRVAPRSRQAPAYALARRARASRGAPPLPVIADAHSGGGAAPTSPPLPARRAAQGFDVVMLPVIDWHFRHQRPQQLATHLADLGHRVLYLTTTFRRPASDAPPFEVLEQVAPAVWTCRLALDAPHPVIYTDRLDPRRATDLADALRTALHQLRLDRPVLVVQHPFWSDVARRLGEAVLVYDLMDDHEGFDNTAPWVLEAERELLQLVDVTTVTAPTLQEKVPGRSVLVRNGAEVSRFRAAAQDRRQQPGRDRLVIGYVGAIAHWFDTDLVGRCADARPEWDFVLVGDTTGSDARRLEDRPNVRFLGERPYADVPELVAGFDVCLIPFHVIPLTMHTNPVKAYEYLAAGKPVVATAMPEVIAMAPHVHVGHDHEQFLEALETAVAEVGDADLAAARAAWADRHSWGARAEAFLTAVDEVLPTVSVVVLCYGNLALTRACLESLERCTTYDGWELVLVDNASPDGTADFLRQYAQDRPHVRLVLNDENLGFAEGNNVGVRASSGDVVVLLNNDTEVTEGWLLGLARHLRDDEGLGLVGPVTDNIGNEARVVLAEGQHWRSAARAYTSQRLRRLLELPTVAFFCVAFRRSTWDAVGELDARFGTGFFEDDDYCRRVADAGLRVAVADDVFVHHHLSASFDALGAARKQALFERNKALYEQKWGPWVPHEYREAPR